MAESYETPVLYRDHKLLILDQTRLPGEEIYIEIKSKEDLWDAIYHLKVRGAPAIGVAAAYGLCVAAGLIAGEMRENAVNSRKESKNFDFETEQFCRKIEEAAAYIKEHVKKPVVSLIVGRNAPQGKSLGHAGAIVSGNVGTAKTKIAALQDAGVHVVKNPVEMVETIRSLIV